MPVNTRSRRLLRTIVAILSVCLVATPPKPAAGIQDRPTVPPEDYGRWENLGPAALSPDGAWIAYTVTRVDEDSELRFRRIDDEETHVAEWGRGPSFSADGRWLAWTIGLSPDERERLEEAEETARDGLGLRDLTTGDERTFDAVRAFAFDPTGRFLAVHGYAPEEPEGKGADLRVLDLGADTETVFGNVGSFEWSDAGSMVAMIIATGEDAANGVQVFDADTRRIESLDTSGSAYRQLSWRDGAPDLAVLRSTDVASEDGAGHSVLAWNGLGSGSPSINSLHPTPGGEMDIVRHHRPEWSDDGSLVSIGLRPSEDEDEGGPEDAGDPDDEGDSEDAGDGSAEGEEKEPDLPGVQIWHSGDVRIYPQQTASESADERRSLLAVWNVETDRLVMVGTDLRANARVLEGWRHATERTTAPYPWGEMFGRPYQDVWIVDLATGERTLALDSVRYAWPSSGGRYLVSFDGGRYTSHDLASGAEHDLTSALPTVFADTAYDTPTDLFPPFAFQPSWLEDDAGVLLYDEWDVWRVALDGSAADRLTDGAADRAIHRVVDPFDDDEPGVDADGPIYVRLHGDRSEKRGYGRIAPDGTFEALVFEDKMINGLAKADSADVFVYRSMAFDDSPDYFVADGALEDEKQVTETNPFMSEYAWGRSEVIDYVSEQGRPLQAALYYPAGYEEGAAVPTIVYTYEMLSQNVHNFAVPSERSYYSFTAWTQHGYAVLLPDIVYTWRDPGVSALASVRAAVAEVVDMGVTDPDAVGLIGHSWGGYQATYLPTRTDIFAASVAGAPLTDFVSFMGQIHWNPGVPELSHWETGQGRMEVPFWEDEEAHRRNSPIHKVHELETPLLMAFGNEDGVVDWDQGTEFYNFARRAGKQMVLLVYEGEDHGFRQEANQIDYHRRILEWFGHYLKGEPAPAWITEGIALEDLEDEKRRVAKGKR
ncbi:MAG: prolyl oligopeptidase family serine peptidase [Gemmatimonadetes bacterium]|nr:prolyl oligopeptidase family serine peptidase [Gemmatimonadota bacterium]